MPTVYLAAQRKEWRTGDQRSIRKFHSSDKCSQLRKRPARGEAHPVEQADLRDLRKVMPCKFCYPDAPRAHMTRRFCPQCNKRSALACQHNGGVPVYITNTTSARTLTRDPGDTYTKLIYVWPDRAHLYYSN